MNRFLLSICIPTYNFGKFIGQTLDSILPQVTKDVEVLILDGGSTDHTDEVVESRRKIYPQLKYYHQEFRGGIDRDIEEAVSMAQGGYCWLFSADDIMLPDAIGKVLDAIKSDYDIYLCEHDLCTLNMNFIKEYPIFKNIHTPKVFDLSDGLQRKEYFRSARTSEAFFSFLAGPIFKKQTWDSVDIPESFYGTHWIVAGHLLGAISRGLMVEYLHKTLLHQRGENDSFAKNGTVNRYRIAIEYFQHIGEFIFGNDSEEMVQIRRVLQRDIRLHNILLAKLQIFEDKEEENKKILDWLVAMHYVDGGIKNRMSVAIYKRTPAPVLRAVRWFLNELKKRSWVANFLRRQL